MKLKFWGVRGSIPTPGKYTVKYGGNTTCMQLMPDDGETFGGEVLVIDAGTGIRELGLALMALPNLLLAVPSLISSISATSTIENRCK